MVTFRKTWQVIPLIILALVTGVSAVMPVWDRGPAQVGPVYFAEYQGDFYWSPNPTMSPFQLADSWENDGVTYYKWNYDGHSWSASECSLIDALTSAPSTPSVVTTRKSPPKGPSTEELARAALARRQQWTVETMEIQRAKQNAKDLDAATTGNRTSMNSNKGGKKSHSSGGTDGYLYAYTPPEEALRSWRYDLSTSARRSERHLRLPEGGAPVYARSYGADVDATFTHDRWVLIAGFSYNATDLPGALNSLDNETFGGRILGIYRLLEKDVEGFDLQLLGSLGGSRVRYDREIPGVSTDTSFVTPGAGVTAGRLLGRIGELRAVYFFHSTIALGQDRRQVTGDREINVHTGGLSYHAGLYADARSVVVASLQALYQYVPDLPAEWDNDSVSVSGMIAYRRDQWGASLNADRTIGDAQTGGNWGVRLGLHRNF